MEGKQIELIKMVNDKSAGGLCLYPLAVYHGATLEKEGKTFTIKDADDGTVLGTFSTLKYAYGVVEKMGTTPPKRADFIKELNDRLERLEELLRNDPAGMASTMLHRVRTALAERSGAVEFLCEVGAITMDDAEALRDRVRSIENNIKELLKARIKWHAARIDETIEARKTNGTYKGEFTTAVLLANAYNDIFNSCDFEG